MNPEYTESLLKDKKGEPLVLRPEQREYEGYVDFVPIRKGTLTLFQMDKKRFARDDCSHNLVSSNDKFTMSHVCYHCGNIHFRLKADHNYTGNLHAGYDYDFER